MDQKARFIWVGYFEPQALLDKLGIAHNLTLEGSRGMTAYTHQTAPTQFVETDGIRFAYRRFGKPSGVPLVFNQHFTGTMDHWDPAVADGLAQDREVIHEGVERSQPVHHHGSLSIADLYVRNIVTRGSIALKSSGLIIGA